MHLLENSNKHFSAERDGGGRDAAFGSRLHCLQRLYLLKEQSEKSRRQQKMWTQSWLKKRVVLLYERSPLTSVFSASLSFLLPSVWGECSHHVSNTMRLERKFSFVNLVVTARKDELKSGCKDTSYPLQRKMRTHQLQHRAKGFIPTFEFCLWFWNRTKSQ